MKRVLSLILGFVIILGMVPGTQAASSDETYAWIAIGQESIEYYEIIVKDDVVFFSGDDLAALTGYTYSVAEAVASFTRGAKTVSLDIDNPALYFHGHGKPLKIEFSQENIRYSTARERYFFSGAHILPWLGVSCRVHDGVFYIIPDAVSYWDIIGDFKPEDFSFDYMSVCEALDVGGKWVKAGAYIRDSGLGMLWDIIPVDFGVTIGSLQDYYDIFNDMFIDMDSTAYAVQKTLERAAKAKSLLLLEEMEAAGVPMPWEEFSTVFDVADLEADVMEYFTYFDAFQNDNTAKLRMMETLYLNAKAYTIPVEIAHAAVDIERDYTDYWGGLVRRLFVDVGYESLEALVSLATGGTVLEKLLTVLEASSDLAPDWTEGVARISDYDVLAEYAKAILKGSTRDSKDNIEESISAAIVYLYARECNYRAMAEYARVKCGDTTVANTLYEKAEEALKWQGYFLAAFPSAENASYEYNPPGTDKIVLGQRSKNEYVEKLKNMLSQAEILREAPERQEGAANPAQYHELFLEFLRSFKWLNFASFDASQVPLDDYERMQWGYYYFHDVDQDGTDDLVIVAGTSSSGCMVFTGRGGFIACYGAVDCAYGLSVFASGNATGLILSEAHGGLGFDSYLDIVNGALTVLKTDEYNYESTDYVSGIPSGWTRLEGHEIGSLFSGDLYDGEEGDSEFPVDDTIEVDCLGGRLTLTLPGTWLGHFLTVEGEQSVSFYNKENHEADESTGLLFTVVLSDYQSEKELEVAGYPDYRNLGRWEGGLVIALLPSDVQFSETNSALADAYLSMNNDINIVLITLTING